MNIEYWRTEIDEIDRELLRLLNRRARLAMKVGALKRATGLSCCDPEREREVLGTLQQANTGPLDRRAITKLFRSVIRESRRVEAQVLNGEEGKRGRGEREQKPAITSDAVSDQGTEAHEVRM